MDCVSIGGKLGVRLSTNRDTYANANLHDFREDVPDHQATPSCPKLSPSILGVLEVSARGPRIYWCTVEMNSGWREEITLAAEKLMHCHYGAKNSQGL